jgi:hypothetical protein
MQKLYKYIKYVLLFLVGFSSAGFAINLDTNKNEAPIEIQWVENLKGDFEFRNNWSYPEGVYRNSFGQLDCDGFCPEGIDIMKDDEGRIYTDLLPGFYQLVDTTHQFHSILCYAWCYEWAGANFIQVKLFNKNEIVCTTQTNAGTHCSLVFEIKNNVCIPRIELNSISTPELKIYYCKGGHIAIDKELLEQNVLKAEFSFDFINTDESDKKMFWEGKIYTVIEK